jgi:triacylglycerol lipase
VLGRTRKVIAGSVAALVVAALAPAAANAAGPVVLVSGFDTITPFTTPDPSCNGKEGDEWNPPNGIAATLKAAGLQVFTAPVMQAGNPPAAPCAPGTPVPPVDTTYINANGDVNANGLNLGRFLAFLRDNYGVTNVEIVAHSDGGLWSRSAITQQANFAGVAVNSYTTLGTPQTGSLIADLSQYVQNGNCDASNEVVQVVCEALQSIVNLVVKDLGPTTINELTSEYLMTWNPEQTMGACPAAGIAGTYFNLPIPPSLISAYYNPLDGLVGEASAHGEASKSISGTTIPAPGIPNYRDAGSFPVVHGFVFSFLTSANLLNQAPISNTVLSTIQNLPVGVPTCTLPTPAPIPPAPDPPGPTDGQVKVTIPLHRYLVPFRGTLPAARKGDSILTTSRALLFCGKRLLRSTLFPGYPANLRVTIPRCKKRITVRGGGKVMLIRTVGTARVTIEGNGVTVQPKGLRARRTALELKQGKRFVRIPLNQSGTGKLPAGAGPTTLRVTVTTKSKRPRGGRRVSGSATVSR